MKKNIKKVKKFQKSLICLVVISALIVGFLTGKIMNANAEGEPVYDYAGSEIGYDSTNNSLSATNVSDALDELYEKVGQCPKGKLCVELSDTYNSNIVKAYTYDESICVTGNEEACVETSCYKASVSNACPVGTIVDYKVNDETTKRFHVLHDDGRNMTMQSQKNTVYNVAWYRDKNDSSNGPMTIMSALKLATDDWTNVNLLSITSETNSFLGVDEINNLCINDSEGNVTCLENVYDIGVIANTYRARMITMQEATDPNIGQCLAGISESVTNNKSCRMFMNNFLFRSQNLEFCRNIELCAEDDYVENGADHNWGYLTMSAFSSSRVWRVNPSGNVATFNVVHASYGARAVVVVNK